MAINRNFCLDNKLEEENDMSVDRTETETLKIRISACEESIKQLGEMVSFLSDSMTKNVNGIGEAIRINAESIKTLAQKT